LKISEKKPVAQQNATGLEAMQKLLHGADDQTIAVHSTFNGDTEESVVVDILGTGAGGGGTHGAATGESNSDEQSSENNSKLFHFYNSNDLLVDG
jgi:hypothetical protein